MAQMTYRMRRTNRGPDPGAHRRAIHRREHFIVSWIDLSECLGEPDLRSDRLPASQ
jgi:hypothetical protein